MRILTAGCCAIAVTAITACAPAGPPPPLAEPTPAVAGDEVITEMDFESGEVQGEEVETVEEAPEATPVPE